MSTVRAIPSVKPNALQQEAVTRLYNKLLKDVGVLKEMDQDSDLSLRSYEYTNVYGVFGPRGAGKSTVLHSVYQAIDRRRQEADDGCSFTVLPTLDCSMIPLDVAPSVAILSRINQFLTERSEKEAKEYKERDQYNTQMHDNVVQSLKNLKATCSRTGEAYRDLCIELSSSPADYSHFLQKGIDERLQLWGDIRKWLREAAALVSCESFVVLLDDFDLVPDDQVRRWLFSFLDELHQVRLQIVLAADFYRLEHLAWDPRAGFDDKTGRAVLHKITPAPNRINLDVWPAASRASFSRHRRPVLSELIRRYANGWSADSALLMSLVPHRPRGLVNLHDSLFQQRDYHRAGDEPNITEIKQTLALLATCRNEPLFARDLANRCLGDWTAMLRFANGQLSTEEWNETVEEALDRVDQPVRGGTVFLKPLRALSVVTNAEQYHAYNHVGSDANRGLWQPEENRHPAQLAVACRHPTPGGLHHDPTWRDPFRHDQLWMPPMRDAEPDDWPLWTELLLNLTMASLPGQDDTVLARRRVNFLERWQPAAHRLEWTHFSIPLKRGQLREFFIDHEDDPINSAVLWMTWKPEQPLRLEVGWRPLLAALRGARDPLLAEQLAVLALKPSIIGGAPPPENNAKGTESAGNGTAMDTSDAPREEAEQSRDASHPALVSGSAEALSLLPDEVWALVVLVDALDRCCWKVFSGPYGIPISTYLLLAGVMVKSAYLYGLVVSGLVDEDKLSNSQQEMHRRLADRDPTDLLLKPAEELDSYLRDLVAEQQPEISGTDALSRAAKAIFSSPACTTLTELRTFYLEQHSTADSEP